MERWCISTDRIFMWFNTYLLIQKQFIPCLPWFILLIFWSILTYDFAYSLAIISFILLKVSCIKVFLSAKVFIQSPLQQEPGRDKPTKKKSIIFQPWGNSWENLQHYKPTEAKNKTGNFCTKLSFCSSPTSHRRAQETQQQIQNLWVLFKTLGVKFLSSEQTGCAASPASGFTENMDF